MDRRNDRGGVGLWIALALLGVAIWAGIRIGKLYFDKSTLENEVALLGDNALTSRDIDVKSEIQKLISVYDVELKPEEINVEFNGARDRVTISFNYVRYADLVAARPAFPFRISVQREAAKAVGVIQQVQDSIEGANNASARKYQKAVEDTVGRPP